MAGRIFISYRRSDSTVFAHRMFDRLVEMFGPEAVFIDIDRIPPGVDFRTHIKGEIAGAHVVLVVIGARWLDEMRVRAADADDVLRLEVETALALAKDVVPVLTEGGGMPRAADLPPSLAALPSRNAVQVSEAQHFGHDMERLAAWLVQAHGFARRTGPPGGAKATDPEAVSVRVGDKKRSELRRFKPGDGLKEWFKDFHKGPELVVVPAGSFRMGSDTRGPFFPETGQYRYATEQPQREVSIATAFAVGRYAVTREEFAAFTSAASYLVEEGAFCGINYDDPSMPPKFVAQSSWLEPGFDQGMDHPVICVSWNDANAYVDWLAEVTGHRYRLPSEAEWEYVCRAGTNTKYWWGDKASYRRAKYVAFPLPFSFPVGWMGRRAAPVSKYEPNAWGLYQVHGNVFEWCQDEYDPSYAGAPADGTAVETISSGTKLRVARGGSWELEAENLRASRRGCYFENNRFWDIGFRVVREL